MATPGPADFGDERVLIIKINRSLDEGRSVYDATRAAWRVSRERAASADWVVAARAGEILDVFVADRWLDAFDPEIRHLIDAENDSGRSGFVGRRAPDRVRNRWVGHQLPARFMKQGASNPVWYVNL